MKALILAGGRGSRLRPITSTINKQMIPIANKPMIERVIEDAIDIGVDDIIININQGDRELPALLGDGKRWKVRIRYVEQPTPNGMMYPIKLAQELIGDEEFFFSAGDNILAGGLQPHYDDFKRLGSDAHVLVVKRPDFEQFGVAVLKDGLVVKTVEKPKKYISDLVLTAIYFFTPSVFESFNHIKPIDPKGTGKPEYYPPVVNNWLIEQGYKFTASEITGWWKDTGSPKDLISANRMILENEAEDNIEGKISDSDVEGKVSLGNKSKIINSVVRGPAIIGKNTVIENSYIGPFTSIGNGVYLNSVEIENSIVMDNSRIENLERRLDSSLIGSNTIIKKDNKIRSVSTLVVGDNSVVSI